MEETPKAEPERKSKPVRKPKAERKPKPEVKSRPTRKPAPKPEAEPKEKVAAAKPARFRGKPASEKRPERPSKPRRPRRPAAAAKGGRALATGAGKVGTGVRSVGAELLKLGREMVSIPVQLWLAGAEIAGAIVLRVWLRAVRPLAVWLWRTGRATLRFAQDHVKPAHGVIAVSLVAVERSSPRNGSTTTRSASAPTPTPARSAT